MRILIVDDDPGIASTLSLHLGRRHAVETARTLAGAREALRAGAPDAVLLDLKLPDGTGLEFLERLREEDAQIPVIMITGHSDMQSTIEAMRRGAVDYIRKPLDIDAIEAALLRVEREIEARALAHALNVEASFQAGQIVGSSRAITDLLKRIGVAARSRVWVLVLGESGTGKELVARTIHAHASPGEAFVGMNCSAIVPTLLESELFGHERGAFTGADRRKIGKLELAGRGTVFFDEIADLPLDLQAKLLRVLQEREFERVGGTDVIRLEARVIAATNRDLEALVAEKVFRDDLYYRLCVNAIRIPPLRERREDIPLLVEHLTAKINRELHKCISRVREEDLDRLKAHDWPGNVRELENVLMRAALASAGTTLDLSGIDLGPPALPRAAGPRTLAAVEKEHILSVLRAVAWNITRASDILGISRPTLRKKVRDYGLDEGA